MFDVILTTFNRPNEVASLVKSLSDCTPPPHQTIVVDSSDEENRLLQNLPGIVYIRSSHKNQPYQRFLGAAASTSSIIIFLDDDLTLIRQDIFQLILNTIATSNVAGVSVGFQHDNSTSQDVDVPIWNDDKVLFKTFWKFTGVPVPNVGNMNRLGVNGAKPIVQSDVQSFSGAIMAYKREVFTKIFLADLLSLYERKLGKGEDKVISMSILPFGKLIYIPEICLIHPPNESSYFQNMRSFTAKVTYSRLYLSRIYAQVFQKSWWKELLLYYWFTYWRVLIAFISMLIRPSQNRKDKFLGTLDGLWLALTLPQKAEKLTPSINWEAEIQKDLTSAKHATGSI